MTTYFTSKAPSKSGRRAITSIKDLDIDLSTINTTAELQKLSPKNAKAKQDLLAKYTADFSKWLLPLRYVLITPLCFFLSFNTDCSSGKCLQGLHVSIWHMHACLLFAQAIKVPTHWPVPVVHIAMLHKCCMPCREGFSLLFYGFGSKKALLETFARDCLTDGGVVAFNGYMPSLNIREILLRVATLLRVSRWVSKGTPATASHL